MKITNIDILKNIKILINLQSQYLDNLLKKEEKWHYNPDKAGFLRLSLEIQKQVIKYKKNE